MPKFPEFDYSEIEAQHRRDRAHNSDVFTNVAKAFEQVDPDGVTPLKDSSKEEGQVLAEIAYGENPYNKDREPRARLVKDAHYYRLHIGYRRKSKPEDFCITRRITLTEEEIFIVSQLLTFTKTGRET